MTPECPKCASTSTRRRSRANSLQHRFMFLLGQFPWECLNCQRRFFSNVRYNRSHRHPQGEVYVGSNVAEKVNSGAKQHRI